MKQQAFATVSVPVILLVVGMISVWVQQPLLIASLGAAVFSQLISPNEQSSKPYHIAVSQIVGALAAMVAVFALRAFDMPLFLGGQLLVAARVLAVALACLITLPILFALRVQSPTGGATAVLVATGLETTDWAGATRLLAGICLTVTLGEACRRVAAHLSSK